MTYRDSGGVPGVHSLRLTGWDGYILLTWWFVDYWSCVDFARPARHAHIKISQACKMTCWLPDTVTAMTRSDYVSLILTPF